MKNTICDEDQAMIERFLEQTRELSNCARCTNLLNDPVKAKCGHLLCRTCMLKKIDNHASSLQARLHCACCLDEHPSNAAEEVSLKIRNLSSCLQQFVKDFCSAEHFSAGNAIGKGKNSGTQKSVLFKDNVQAEESSPAIESETCSGSILISGQSSPSLTNHSALPSTQKVGQWLMTNPSEDPSIIQKEEDYWNSTSIKKSRSLSFQSLKVSPSNYTISSNGKELSYDIVSAPSPPPSHDVTHPQVKDSRSRRGRGRPRKNALPISSGETIAKKRERSKSITPETKLARVKTPILHFGSSQDMDEVVASKAVIETPIATSLPAMFPLVKNNGIGQFEGSIQSEENILKGETRQVLVDPGVQLTLDLDKSTDRVEDERSSSATPANAEIFHQLPPMSVSSPKPEKSNWAPSTAHHLTPVSRPKTQNSAPLARNYHQSSAQKFHCNAPTPAFSGERRIVTFFHKGRMTPRTSVNSIKSQYVAFTRLGRLGPILDMPTSVRPFLDGSCIDSEKMVDIKGTQTCPLPVVTLASIATQTDAIEAACILTKKAQSQNDANSQTSQVCVLSSNTVLIDDPLVSPCKQTRNKRSDEIHSTRDSDECSEDMFAEPLKRPRVLSFSDNEKAEPKRMKPLSSVVVNSVPVSLTPVFVETNTVLAKETRQHSAQLNMVEAEACRTVVMESDADSDEGDILPATPPRLPTPNPSPCKRIVFTCSGIPRPQIKMIEDWAQKVGAEVSLTYNSCVTHIIVCLDEENCAQRTLKFLYGVANGNWIIGVDWVHQCIRENRLIEEEPFEALDMDGEDGPRRARQNRQKEKLFEAFEFCCQGPFTDVTVDQLNELLQLCGASTVSSPSQLTKTRQYTMIVVQTEDDVNLEVGRKAVKWFDSFKVVSVSREWVLDCLAAYQLLPVRNQLIGKYSVSMLKMMGFDARLII